jgi:K+-sensing histidine kinase KdpD
MTNKNDALHLDFSFISTLCHELRSPLFPIIALSDLLLKQPDAASDHSTLRAHITMMHDAGHYLLALVQDLHTVSRIETHRCIPKVSTFDLIEFLKDPGPDPSKASTSRVPPAILDFAESVPAGLVLCEQEALRHIFQGLTEIFHCHQPEPEKERIRLSCTSNRIQFEVSLPHLTDEQASKLLVPFWTIPWNTSARQRTNGLAFCLVRCWSESLGGTCQVQTEDSHVVLRVSLPFRTIDLSQTQMSERGTIFLVSHDFTQAYASLLVAAHHGEEAQLLTLNRYKEININSDAIVLVDRACVTDIPGMRVDLPITPATLDSINDSP